MKLKFEREYLYLAILIATLFWAITATLLAGARANKTLIFIQDDAGIHSLNDNSLDMKRREKLLITQKFVGELFSYDSATYKSNVLEAKNYMDSNLWEKHLKEFDELNDRLKKVNLIQLSTIENISEKDDKVQVLARLKVNSNLESKEAKVLITLKLEAHERSITNPYQYEVTDYDESTSIN